MESSRKIFAAIVAAGIMGSGAAALAEPGRGCDGPMGMSAGKFDPAGRVDARLGRLESDLKLTAEQKPLWQAYAEKSKAEAGKGFQAMREQAQDLGLSAPDRMTRMTETMKQRVVAMESINAAFRQLYDALSPEQKRVADIHAARSGHMGPGEHRGPGGRGGPPGGMPPPRT